MTDDAETLEIRLLLEAIRARYGYDFSGYSPDSMRRRVLAALAKSQAPNLGELQHRVLTDADAFAAALDELTVRVTELYRDPHVYRALRERVMPVLKTYPSIKIWHAGCATGEEVYTTAVMLRELGLYDRAQIYATDLSARALEHAKQGTYRAEVAAAFRENHEASGAQGPLDAHYIAAYGGIAFNEALKRNVLFFQHNLASDHPFGEMHLVFCRNVLIYFGRELRARVLDMLTRSLCPGGFLCLGANERLSRQELAKSYAEFAGAERIYRHEGSA